MTEGRDEGWERQVLERLALETLAEQRTAAPLERVFSMTLACVATALWIFGGFR